MAKKRPSKPKHPKHRSRHVALCEMLPRGGDGSCACQLKAFHKGPHMGPDGREFMVRARHNSPRPNARSEALTGEFVKEFSRDARKDIDAVVEKIAGAVIPVIAAEVTSALQKPLRDVIAGSLRSFVDGLGNGHRTLDLIHTTVKLEGGESTLCGYAISPVIEVTSWGQFFVRNPRRQCPDCRRKLEAIKQRKSRR